MNKRPASTLEMQALPIGPAWGIKTEVRDGQTINIPVSPDVRSVFHGPDDIIGYRDENGQQWTLGRYGSGEWFRQRSTA